MQTAPRNKEVIDALNECEAEVETNLDIQEVETEYEPADYETQVVETDSNTEDDRTPQGSNRSLNTVLDRYQKRNQSTSQRFIF